ncbi:MAG TPA: peptidylprolyl isomerase [Kofleriaceae bacterium]
MKCLVVVLALFGACGPGSPGGPTMSHRVNSDNNPPEISTSAVVSKEILSREPVSNTADVKHILLSWKDLAEAFGGRQDKRAEARTKADAEAETKKLFDEIKGGGDFDALMKQHSEDLGSAASGRVFTVTPDSQLVIEFRQLALRLNLDEVGVVESDFGFHIIKRYK